MTDEIYEEINKKFGADTSPLILLSVRLRTDLIKRLRKLKPKKKNRTKKKNKKI